MAGMGPFFGFDHKSVVSGQLQCAGIAIVKLQFLPGLANSEEYQLTRYSSPMPAPIAVYHSINLLELIALQSPK